MVAFCTRGEVCGRKKSGMSSVISSVLIWTPAFTRPRGLLWLALAVALVTFSWRRTNAHSNTSG